ncbi:hypothetical protein ElyMa_001554400 [Elysia marginata]|uniref:Uncharacterized protein n=1 Tax=Elysia marginata TaxID=1093978 RepID=A0AAV4JAL0_9GAST|nr:hypothetical protein ElyMa_001554400 [Elysia marginata]
MSSYEFFFTNHNQPYYPYGQKDANFQSSHQQQQQQKQQNNHYPSTQYYQSRNHHYHHYHHQKYNSNSNSGGIGLGATTSSVGCVGGVGGLHSPPVLGVCSQHGSSGHAGAHSSTGHHHDAASLLWKTPQNDETVSITSSVSSNVSPSSASSMFFSVLKRDLDLSSDESEAEQTSDDDKTSASQSKKGKVIGPSGGGAPVKIPQSPSSSSNSSSESSSENENNEDDEEEEETNANSPQAKGKKMPKSSNSSSDSESDSGSNDDEDDDEDDDDNKSSKEEVQATSPEEKLSSPSQYKPGGTASSSLVQESVESGMSWRLDNFIQTPKKNTNSPPNQSPLKSPNSVHSGPPSVKNKEESVTRTPDSSRFKSLKDIGPSVTMPFDPGVTKESALDSDDNLSNRVGKNDESDYLDSHEDNGNDSGGEEDDEDDRRMKKKKRRKKLVSSQEVTVKSHSSSSASLSYSSSKHRSSLAAEQSESKLYKNQDSSASKKKDPAQRPTDLKVSSSLPALGSSEKIKRQNSSSSSVSKSAATTPVKSSESGHKRKKSSKTTSHSDDEIDVVTFTPDVKARQRLSPSPGVAEAEDKRKQEASKRLFDKHSSDDCSDESDSKLSAPRGKNAHIHDTKRHRRKQSSLSSPSLTPSDHPIYHTAQITAGKIVLPIPKKFSSDSAAYTLKQLESIARAPNLLAPVSPTFSPPPGSTSKEPLPSFEQSFSPAPHPAGSTSIETSSLVSSPRPSIVVYKPNHDGTSQPQITVEVPVWRLPERSLIWLKEKRRKSRTASSSSAVLDKVKEETSLREKSPHKSSSSSSSGLQYDSKSCSRVPPHTPDSKLSSPSSGKRGGGANSDIPHQKAFNSSSSSLHESSGSAATSKPEKRKLSDSNGLGHSVSSSLSSTSQYKIPKTSKNSKRESSQGFSNQSPASGSAEKSSSTKSNKLQAASPDISKSGGSTSTAVKNLDFSTKTSDDHSVVANGAPSSGPSLDNKQGKPSKRKGNSREEVPNKRSKSDNAIEKEAAATANVAEPTLKRQDSAGSSSGRSSHKSSAESSSSSSLYSKKTDRDNGGGSNNNNSIEKVTNGPDNSQLPFNHYVNGSAPAAADVNNSSSSTLDAITTNSNTKRGHSASPTPSSLSSTPLPPSSSYPGQLPQPPPVEKDKKCDDEIELQSSEKIFVSIGLFTAIAARTITPGYLIGNALAYEILRAKKGDNA